MKYRLLFALLFAACFAKAQETPPTGLKATANVFYIAPDGSMWLNRGNPWGFVRTTLNRELTPTVSQANSNTTQIKSDSANVQKLFNTVIANGYGLIGGGDLRANRSFYVDTTLIKSKAAFLIDYQNLTAQINTKSPSTIIPSQRLYVGQNTNVPISYAALYYNSAAGAGTLYTPTLNATNLYPTNLNDIQTPYRQSSYLSNNIYPGIYMASGGGASYPHNMNRALIIQGGSANGAPGDIIFGYGATGITAFYIKGNTGGVNIGETTGADLAGAGSLYVNNNVRIGGVAAGNLIKVDANQRTVAAVAGTDYLAGATTLRTSAATLTLVASQDIFFEGSTSTFTLPAPTTSNAGRNSQITISNAGTGTITINGTIVINGTAASPASTDNIVTGAAVTYMSSGTYWKRQ